VREAARLLRAGGVVAFPTETVYGLGADAANERAGARVFEVKRRPWFDPLIVHVARADAAASVAHAADPRVALLAGRFWPGPLTLVLPRRGSVADLVTAGLDTVGVRVPDHATARALIEAAGRPLAAPSANPFGYVSPTTAAHVAEQLGDEVDLILDAGACRVGLESTIVSLAKDPPRLLRAGGVPREELEAALGHPLELVPPSDRPSAPGQLSRHYATRTRLQLLHGRPGRGPADAGRVGLLAFSPPPPALAGWSAIEVLAPDGDMATAAAALFAALRRLDALGLDLILAETCAETGLGRAIMDRLRRCAAG
jgi:L-threonylcarbamoyladenylate synthase